MRKRDETSQKVQMAYLTFRRMKTREFQIWSHRKFWLFYNNQNKWKFGAVMRGQYENCVRPD